MTAFFNDNTSAAVWPALPFSAQGVVYHRSTKEYYYSIEIPIVLTEQPWAEHLTSQPKRKWGLLMHLTTKERPHHAYSDLIPLKQIIQQTITQKKEAMVVLRSSPDSTRHSERHTVTVSVWCAPY